MGDCHVNVQGCGPCLGTCVSGDVGGVCVGIGVNIDVGARFCISVGICVVVKQPDSIIEDGTATAAWLPLRMTRLPASSQDSLVGSHDEIEVKKS